MVTESYRCRTSRSSLDNDLRHFLDWTQPWPAYFRLRPNTHFQRKQQKVWKKYSNILEKRLNLFNCMLGALLPCSIVAAVLTADTGLWWHTHLFTEKEHLASRFPIFRTNKTLEQLCLTGQDPKFISSGKSKMARAPIAWTGTTNFSRSVKQTSSCV